jgi:hypothetical protein
MNDYSVDNLDDTGKNRRTPSVSVRDGGKALSFEKSRWSELAAVDDR